MSIATSLPVPPIRANRTAIVTSKRGKNMQYSMETQQIMAETATARSELSALNGVVGDTEQTMSDASSAFHYSTLSNAAAQACLEYFIKHDVEMCRDRSQKNVSATEEALSQYTEADVVMYQLSHANVSAVPQLDIPGSGSAPGADVCAVPAADAASTFDTDSIGQARQASETFWVPETESTSAPNPNTPATFDMSKLGD